MLLINRSSEIGRGDIVLKKQFGEDNRLDSIVHLFRSSDTGRGEIDHIECMNLRLMFFEFARWEFSAFDYVEFKAMKIRTLFKFATICFLHCLQAVGMAVSLDPNTFWISFGWMKYTMPLKCAERTEELYAKNLFVVVLHEVRVGRKMEPTNFMINRSQFDRMGHWVGRQVNSGIVQLDTMIFLSLWISSD
jgi:hypothetical protein